MKTRTAKLLIGIPIGLGSLLALVWFGPRIMFWIWYQSEAARCSRSVPGESYEISASRNERDAIVLDDDLDWHGIRPGISSGDDLRGVLVDLSLLKQDATVHRGSLTNGTIVWYYQDSRTPYRAATSGFADVENGIVQSLTFPMETKPLLQAFIYELGDPDGYALHEFRQGAESPCYDVSLQVYWLQKGISADIGFTSSLGSANIGEQIFPPSQLVVEFVTLFSPGATLEAYKKANSGMSDSDDFLEWHGIDEIVWP